MSEEALAARSVEALREAIRRGATPRYVFFWSAEPARPASLDTSCLSQWFPAPFDVDGVLYETAEHFMMAEKARLFGDHDRLEAILAARHPGEAKQLGREVRGFDAATWEHNRIDIVTRGNLTKFETHPDLREYLVGTRKRVLVEASPVDRIWGVGLAADDPQALNPDAWLGQNLLGFTLMAVRERLPKKETTL